MAETGQFEAFIGIITKDSVGLFTKPETGNFSANIDLFNNNGFVLGLLPPANLESGESESLISLLTSNSTPTPSLDYVTFNPLDFFAGYTLTSGDYVAELTTANGLWDGGRGDIGFSTGKHQVFFKILAQSLSNGIIIGLGNLSAPLGVGSQGYPGDTADSWGYRPLDNLKFHLGNNNTGLSGGVGDVFGILYDADAGTMSINKNGGAIIQIFTSVTGTLFPMVGAYDNGAIVQIGSSIDFGLTLETDYEEWAVPL